MGVATDKKQKDKKPAVTESNSPAVEGMRHIIARAAEHGATDIHIEPRDQFIWVRYRIGDVLQLGTKLPLENLKSLLSTGKKLAGLSTKEMQRPQEGNFDISLGDEAYYVHLSTIPVLGGEKMVIHMSPESSKLISLDRLGYWGPNLEHIKRALGQLRGFIIIGTSDRNSGSLALLGMANLVSHPSVKLGAIGNPLLDHVSHIGQASKNLKPDRQLRLLLRQEPDVVLINDLFDKNMAKTALELAKIKLVCCGAMAPDTSVVLQRLSNMGHDSALLAGALSLAGSQTIIRKLCEHCHEAYSPPIAIRKRLDSLIDDFPLSELHKLELLAIKSGLGTSITKPNTTPGEITRLWRAKDGGCARCGYSGYRHYTTINEVVDASAPEVQRLMTKPAIQKSQIQTAVNKAGMIPKHIDGLIKCLRGLVAIDDVATIARGNDHVHA